MHYPGKWIELNKKEIYTFEHLHKAIRSEEDWRDFSKFFMLYLDGIISITDMFMLFEEKFGYRVKEELKT